MAEQDSALEPDRLEQSGQAETRLAAHVIERTREIDGLGPAIACPRIGEHPVPGRGRKFLRKVTPQRKAAEALMQHDDCRGLIRGRPIG